MKNTELLRTMRMMLSLLLLLCLTFTAAVCGAETAAEEVQAEKAQAPDYLAIGREVTGILDEMLQSRDYQQIYFGGQGFEEQISALYEERNSETSVTVYRIIQGDTKALFLSMMPEKDRVAIESLSPALQEQLWVRMGSLTSSVCSYINGQKGSSVLAVASALTVLLKKPELEPEEPEYLLFVYEKGVPVLVSYGHHSVTGMMLVLDKEDSESLDSIQKIVGIYGFEVLPFEAAED